VIQRVLNQALKTLSNPEYQQQLTKLTQSSIVNSLQTFQRLSTLSTRLSNMDNETMSEVVEGSIDDLTRALLQFNSDQLVLLQRLSARTLEILDAQARQK
jgi:predicted DNA-binding protein